MTISQMHRFEEFFGTPPNAHLLGTVHPHPLYTVEAGYTDPEYRARYDKLDTRQRCALWHRYLRRLVERCERDKAYYIQFVRHDIMEPSIMVKLPEDSGRLLIETIAERILSELKFFTPWVGAKPAKHVQPVWEDLL